MKHEQNCPVSPSNSPGKSSINASGTPQPRRNSGGMRPFDRAKLLTLISLGPRCSTEQRLRGPPTYLWLLSPKSTLAKIVSQHLALQKLAPSKRVPLKWAPQRFAFERSARRRSELKNLARCRLAFSNRE